MAEKWQSYLLCLDCNHCRVGNRDKLGMGTIHEKGCGRILAIEESDDWKLCRKILYVDS